MHFLLHKFKKLFRKRHIAKILLFCGAFLILFSLGLTLKSLRPQQLYFPSSPLITVIDPKGQYQEIELEDFLIGVLAAEMPADFGLEALKAQAIAARTYIVNNMDGQNGSTRHKEAVVCCDFSHCQAYYDKVQLQKNWGRDFDKNYAKIKQAVQESAGQIMVYENEVIDALYFSTCGGATCNSEDYWSESIPYLRGIECGFCSHSPRFENRESFSLQETATALGCKKNNIKQRIDTLSARTVREKLGLFSAKFSYEINGGNIVFTSHGSGHGVGLCQYGADGMAQEGYLAEEILQHYYTDIEIINIYQQE